MDDVRACEAHPPPRGARGRVRLFTSLPLPSLCICPHCRSSPRATDKGEHRSPEATCERPVTRVRLCSRQPRREQVGHRRRHLSGRKPESQTLPGSPPGGPWRAALAPARGPRAASWRWCSERSVLDFNSNSNFNFNEGRRGLGGAGGHRLRAVSARGRRRRPRRRATARGVVVVVVVRVRGTEWGARPGRRGDATPTRARAGRRRRCGAEQAEKKPCQCTQKGKQGGNATQRLIPLDSG